MEKRDTSLPAATIAADLGLFIHLGGWRPAELERLKKGAGRWMRRIDAAMESWREDLAVSDAPIVAVVLLYRCTGKDRIPFDGPEPIEPDEGMRSHISAPIVVELGEVGSSQIEDLLRGCGKMLEETREAMRLVQSKAADKATARFFVPVVATCVAPQHPRRWKKDCGKRGNDGSTENAARRVHPIRYLYASPARTGTNRNRITIV
jgi:hypothetical protein